MKTEKKRVGTKAEIKAIKNRERRMATAILLAFILLIVAFSSYFTYNFLNQPQNQTTNPASNPESPQPKAAIVDQLSLTIPNQTFVETATNILKNANYSVDYYPGEKVTVEFYRNLPTHGYSIIILRVHSAIGKEGGPPVCLFTSEPYEQGKYFSMELYEQLGRVHYNVGGEEQLYFGILSEFVRLRMQGTFKNSIIIMMGCNGLTYTDMASAFVEKGAKAYISWNSSISASHTDTATILLLQHLITDKQTTNQAIDNTMKEVGPDPAYNSQLTYYPPETEEQTIENING